MPNFEVVLSCGISKGSDLTTVGSQQDLGFAYSLGQETPIKEFIFDLEIHCPPPIKNHQPGAAISH
jgi:hypothetical protein